ncbi:MAG: hypothetical protein DMG70_28670 [Acidobacteria bacterium]|nr:MAG: hypothetical protein DMG70_28670 [Acidobacteriota bacterium]
MTLGYPRGVFTGDLEKKTYQVLGLINRLLEVSPRAS